MSSEAKPLTQVPIITSAGLQRFHDAVGVSGECWACGHAEWSILSTSNRSAHAWPAMKEDSRRAGTDLPVLTLACQHCGTLWPIAHHRVAAWLASEEHHDER